MLNEIYLCTCGFTVNFITDLVNAMHITNIKLSSQPALWKAPGIASAPVPTIRLNTKTMPTWYTKHMHVYIHVY